MNEQIYDIIWTTIVRAIGPKKWGEKREEILNKFETFSPDKPDDGTSGFLAFNCGESKPRMKIKIGRFLTKKLSLNSGFLDDQTIQRIAEKINDLLFPNIEFMLCKGRSITDNYEESIGGSSCMTGSDCDKTLMYGQNPDRFQQLILYSGNNRARAMVHKLDNGKFLLDRIYTDSDYLIDKMHEYAKKQGWFYRLHTSAGGYDIHFDGNEVDDYSQFIVSSLQWQDGGVPYQDTLTRYREGSCLTILHSRAGDSDGTLDNVDGTLGGGYTCDDCGERMSGDEAYTIGDRVIGDCCADNYMYCEDCNEHESINDAVRIDNEDRWVCSSCARENYTECENCAELITNDDAIQIASGEYICESCLDNYTRCENCDEYYPPDMIDDEQHCADCSKTLYAEVEDV